MEPPTPQTETDLIGPSTYANTNTNNNNSNRLQQSCTKCRERKIKCDRNSPCRACIARNCQDECEYVRTNEDRYHISKAKEIKGLRRELNHLKRRLADVEAQEQQKPPIAFAAFKHDYDYADTSWSAGRAQKRRINNRGADGNGRGNEERNWERGRYASGDIYDLNGSVQNGFVMPGYTGFESGNLDGTTAIVKTADMGFNGFQLVPQMSESEASSIHHHNNNISARTLHIQLQQHPQTDFWRGKHVILKMIYQIVCDCDDIWVPSIIKIVRASLSPEEALLSIQRMLLGDHTFMMTDNVRLSPSIPTSFGGGVDMSFTATGSPSDQSPLSGEG